MSTQTIIWATQLLGTLVLIALLFVFFYYLLKRTEIHSSTMMILFFVALGSIGFYFHNWGQLDIYMLSVTIIACFLIIKDKYIGLIPFLMAMCVMTHEGYVMMYFGIVMALLIYRTYNTVDKDRKKYLLCLISTGSIAACLFVYFYYFSVSVSRVHIDEILANTDQILNISIRTNDWALRNMNYIFTGSALPESAMWVRGAPSIYFFTFILAALINVLVCLPVIIIMVKFWRSVFKSCKFKSKKIILTLGASLQLLTLPLILVQIDQARWFYDIVFFNFLFISSMICMGDEDFISAVQKHFKPSVIKFLLIIFYFFFYLNPDIQMISNHYRGFVTGIIIFIAKSLWPVSI